MTGSDLIVAAPWIVFGAALGAICARLYVGRSRARRRRASQRPERRRFTRPPQSGSDTPQPPHPARTAVTGLPVPAKRPRGRQ